MIDINIEPIPGHDICDFWTAPMCELTASLPRTTLRSTFNGDQCLLGPCRRIYCSMLNLRPTLSIVEVSS